MTVSQVKDLYYVFSHISEHAFISERQAIEQLQANLKPYQEKQSAIFERASRYVNDIREMDNSGIEAFMQEYNLSEEEGIALMCLAEALLRIPDSETADALIEDKLLGAKWNDHLWSSDSFFVNISTIGLMFGQRIVTQAAAEGAVKNLMNKMINRLGEPVLREAIRRGMYILGNQFVMANTIEKAIKKMVPHQKNGFLFSFDMLGEGARTDEQAERFFASYSHSIEALSKQKYDKPIHERPSISIKLSALHPHYEMRYIDQLTSELLPRIKALITQAMEAGIAISIDAEESRRLDVSLRLFDAIISDPDFADYDGIGFVLQAYQKRAIKVIEYLEKAATTYNHQIPIRLVKGAYWDSEIKHAQVHGLPHYPVYTHKSHTDLSYMACAHKLLSNPKAFYPQFATHNALTVASILEIAPHEQFEFQKLYGMGDQFYTPMAGKRPIRVYAPVGAYQELLPYLIRRLLENGANNSFVNLVIDKEAPMAKLLQNPLEYVQSSEGQRHDHIPLPTDLYFKQSDHGWLNSRGFELGTYSHTRQLQQGINDFLPTIWEGCSIINGEPILAGKGIKVSAPHDVTQVVGNTFLARRTHADDAVNAAFKAFPEWNAMHVSERAGPLSTLAHLIEKNRAEAISLLMRESGKTIQDAIDEVREAVDFCHFYSTYAETLMGSADDLPSPTGETNQMAYEGRGVFVCISPWNFPMAIFTGQIVAALVTGNTVVTKPAAQSTLIATFMVQLMHKAGIPTDVLHLVLGEGERIGKHLVKHENISGVVFTGSTGTAHYINRTLAKHTGAIPRLIAETGGQNAMMVDSSALLEQACDDIIHSAFGSAGQRCSALRVLYVQDSIADELITLLQGAVAQLHVGSPTLFSTDVGPVIDAKAKTGLFNHIDRMRSKAKLLANSPLKPFHKRGHFVPPHIFEIEHINELEREEFGPILHVVRFNIHKLDQAIEDINSTGFGLTFGIHSRVQSRIDYVLRRIRAGNIYANRSMTGAVVGVQPFGGMGQSGTGPKAGGINYLRSFCVEKTFTNNITAIGGNLELINQQDE